MLSLKPRTGWEVEGTPGVKKNLEFRVKLQEEAVHLGVGSAGVGLAATGVETAGAQVDGEGTKSWASPAAGVRKMGRSVRRRRRGSYQEAGRGVGGGGRPPRGQVQKEFPKVAKWYS